MSKNINLSLTMCGISFKNPLIMASGTFGFGREYNDFYDIGLLGGVSTKGLTLMPREGNMGCRVAQTPSGMLNSVGLQNPGAKYFIENELEFLKKTGTVIIANVAGNTESDYIELIGLLNDTDTQMLELNISCPNVKEGGVAFGVNPKTVEEIVIKAKKASKKPLLVKLSPNVASISENAKAAESGGADAISLINTITAMAIDYKTKRPVLGNITGGLSGNCIKPIALRQVYECYKAVKIPIIGMGGISSAEDVLEFMIAGATAVQVGTANIIDPYASIKILNELPSLLESLNISSITSLTGSLIV